MIRLIPFLLGSALLLPTSCMAEVRPAPAASDIWNEPAASSVRTVGSTAPSAAPSAAQLEPTFAPDGKMVDPAASRASALSLDGFVGYYPRHSELKLGAALVLPGFTVLRPEIQVADNVIGLGVGYRLPLRVLTEALSVSIGAAVSWDVARHEPEVSVYVARLVF